MGYPRKITHAPNIVKKAGGYSGSITIPDIVTYNGLPYRVVRVNNSAFSDCSELQKVDMSASNIIEIKDYAFAGCTNLQSFTVSNSLTTIGYNAFKECSNLISISLPQSVTSIGMGAFSKCSGLTSVTIPQKISTIEQSLFSGCSSLQNITIPDGVTNIGSYAFQSCKSLTKISIPNSVTSLGNAIFSGNDNLQEVSLPADITSLPNSIFDCCKSLKKINIPNKVISIGDYVFEFCNLQSITIPASVKTIGKYAFSFNDNLNDVCCLAQIPPTFDNSNSINRKATIYVYQHTFEAYKSANDWKDYKIIGLSNEDMEDFSKNGFSKGINTDLKCGITSISGSSLKTFNLFVTNKNINAITITKIVAKNPTTEKQLTSLEDESKLGEVEGGDTKEFFSDSV